MIGREYRWNGSGALEAETHRSFTRPTEALPIGFCEVVVDMQPSRWEDALCATLPPDDMNRLFFPRTYEKTMDEVRSICGVCPVRQECEDAGRDEPYGFWGGLTPQERNAPRAA